MFLLLTILFIVVPALEIGLIIKVGQGLGFWPTLAIIFLTATIGAALAKSQGTQVLAKLKQGLGLGGELTTTIIEGFLIFAAGLTLLTPGFVTDAIGLGLLIGPIRKVVALKIEHSEWVQAKKDSVQIFNFQDSEPPPRDDVIDV